MILFERYIDFLNEHKLSERQFTLLYFLYFYETVDRQIVTKISKFIKHNGVAVKDKVSLTSEEDKADLIAKGLIIENSTSKLGYSTTDLFSKDFIFPYSAGQEFVLEYPGFTLIKGVTIPLKAADIHEMRSLYCERIQYLTSEHKEVLLDLEYGKKHNLIKMNIEKFIRAEFWHELRKLRKANTVIDNYTIHTDNDF